MPEYLAPGVYVEEVSTGSRPIEGVSTSTAGMVGVTERGPENVPVLVTSAGDFQRTFGGELSFADFTDPGGRVHGYLPNAVEGFFTNDGRRAFIVRVVSEDADFATRSLFDRGEDGSADTVLLRSAPQDSGTAINAPSVYALSVNPPGANDSVRVGAGSRSEYRQVQNVGADAVHLALSFPLSLSHPAHPAPVTAEEVVRTIDTTNYTSGDFDIVGGANASATSIVVRTVTTAADATALLALPGDGVFEIGAAARAEYLVATSAVDLGGGG